MRYKAKLQIINKELEDYKKVIDGLAKEYSNRTNILKSQYEIAKASEMYSKEYIGSLANKSARIDDLKDSMITARAKSRQKVDEQLNKIDNSLDSYFSAPVGEEFARKVQSISALGLKLTDSEFKSLQNTAHTYLELRLLNQLAEGRTKTKVGTDRDKVIESLENNPNGLDNVSVSSVELPNAYNGIVIPNIDEIYKEYKAFKSAISELLEGYVGQNFELSGLLDYTNPDDWSNGLKYANSNTYFEQDFSGKISKVFDEMNLIIPKSKAPLTSEEKALIDNLFPYQVLASTEKIEETIDKYINTYPELEELFERDPRYSKYLSQVD